MCLFNFYSTLTVPAYGFIYYLQYTDSNCLYVYLIFTGH